MWFLNQFRYQCTHHCGLYHLHLRINAEQRRTVHIQKDHTCRPLFQNQS